MRPGTPRYSHGKAGMPEFCTIPEFYYSSFPRHWESDSGIGIGLRFVPPSQSIDFVSLSNTNPSIHQLTQQPFLSLPPSLSETYKQLVQRSW